jgi:hypothetical protein
VSLATIVETKELVQTVVFALVAGVGVTALFSVAIWGSARYADWRGDRPLAAVAAVAIGMLALLAVVATIVIGVVVMTSK